MGNNSILKFNIFLIFAQCVFFVVWYSMMMRKSFDIFDEVTQDNTLQQEMKDYIQLSIDAPSRLREQKTWCVLDTRFMRKTAKLWVHFPHAMENLLPCWSGLIERSAVVERKIDNDSYEYEANCGILVNVHSTKTNEGLPALDGFVQTGPSYVMQVLEAMGCEVIFGNGTFNKPDHLPASDDWFSPNIYLQNPRYRYIRYINKPFHAHMLRRRFVSDELIKSRKGDGKPLQIGLVQRSGTRVIENLKEIQGLLQKALPDSNITYTEFEYSEVKDQAEWFATKDFIIGAHGAAMINSIFITPDTMVLQMYPPGYFFYSIEPLVEQAGGIALQWYERELDPAIKDNDMGIRNEARVSNFEVPADDVVRHVMYALGKWGCTFHHLAALYGIEVDLI